MQQRQQSVVFGRFALICIAVILMVVGVTFAALRTQQNVLTGSTLTSASASLLMNKQSIGTFQNELPGFSFTGVEPGGPALPTDGHSLYLHNNGSTNLSVNISVNPERLEYSDQANPNLIKLHIAAPSRGEFIDYRLSDLISAYQTGQRLLLPIWMTAGSYEHLQFRMSIDADPAYELMTEQITLNNLDIVLSGVSG